MIAAVTGGTSFVGAALLRRLLREGATCYAIVRPESRRLSALPAGDGDLRVVRAALDDAARWTAQIPGCDVFYHFAWDGVGAQGRADAEIQRRNVDMALGCLDAAAGLGAKRFLFSGSQAEYGLCEGPIAEDRPCAPVIEYGKGKLRFLKEAQRRSAELGMEYVHMRIFSVYGPGDHPWTLISRCLDAFLRDEEVALSSCEQLWNFLHVEDAAGAMCALGMCDLRGEQVFNIAGEETIPLRRYVDAIWRLCGRRGRPAFGAYQNGLEKPHGIEPVIERLKRVTGWTSAISFEAGIREMVEGYGG